MNRVRGSSHGKKAFFPTDCCHSLEVTTRDRTDNG
jgi:hypothetical protein